MNRFKKSSGPKYKWRPATKPNGQKTGDAPSAKELPSAKDGPLAKELPSARDVPLAKELPSARDGPLARYGP
jgi:hypothetical protein